MNSRHKLLLVSIAIMAASPLLLGCGGSGGGNFSAELAAEPAPLQLGGGQELDPAAGAPFALPPLAELERTAYSRQVSEVYSFDPVILRGDEFELADPDATTDPSWDAAVLPAGSREATWAIYRFGALADDTKLGYLEALLGEAPPQMLYYALADYAAGTWRWFALQVPDLGSLEASFSRSLEDGGDYISETGSLYFAVATWDNASCQVRRVTLNVGVRQVYVQGLEATDGASQNEIAISWQALAGAAGYELYFRLAEFPGPLLLLSEVNGGDTTAFVHSDVNPPEHVALADTQYIYFIMAVFPDGYRSQLSGWDTGHCGELP